VRAYLGIKFYEDNRNRNVIERITNALSQAGLETVCVARDLERWGAVRFSPEELMRRTFAVIRSSNLVVIELSEKGVGLGIEAGYAYGLNIPVVTVARKGSDISPTLRGISHKTYLYENNASLSDFFSSYLGEV